MVTCGLPRGTPCSWPASSGLRQRLTCRGGLVSGPHRLGMGMGRCRAGCHSGDLKPAFGREHAAHSGPDGVYRALRTSGAAWTVVATSWAASSRTGTLLRCDARRSRSNASASLRPDWAIRMPLACSITGMVPSRAHGHRRCRRWRRSASRWR